MCIRDRAGTANEIKQAGSDASVPLSLLDETTKLLADTKEALLELEKVTETAAHTSAGREQAVYYHSVVDAAMEALRRPVDRLEMIVDKEEWPMPSYGDLLFEV